MTHTELAELATTPEGLRQIDAELATLREAVEVLGKRSVLMDKLHVAYRTGRKPSERLLDELKDIEDAVNANPTARAAVEKPAQ